MENWCKILIVTAVPLTALCSFSTAHAAYSLNEQVKTASPALLKAAGIGVLKYENPNMANAANKDAILVTSFGAANKEAREKNIVATVAAIQKVYPRTKIVTAFTERSIVERIKTAENISCQTPEEALDALKVEGYTRVALVPLDIIPAVNYNRNVDLFYAYKDKFKTMTCGTSLMYWQGQEEQNDDVTEVIKAVSGQFPRQQKQEAIILSAHGTPHTANAYYSVMQAKIDELGLTDVYVCTNEGWPRIDDVIAKLKKAKIKSVVLMPLSLSLGERAAADLAGDSPSSHKTALKNAGFAVKVYMHGLGENAAVRNLFVKRTDEAWEALRQ